MLERYQYDAYGKPYFCEPNFVLLTNQESGYDNNILFCGYRFDPETGKYHARHRDLDDYTGRWFTHDPVGYIDGLNLYEYVKSSPINKYDPLGLWIIFRDNQPTAIALTLFSIGDTMTTLSVHRPPHGFH